MFNQSKLQAIKAAIVPQNEALPGRNEEMQITAVHAVNNQDMKRALKTNEEHIVLGMGASGVRKESYGIHLA